MRRLCQTPTTGSRQSGQDGYERARQRPAQGVAARIGQTVRREYANLGALLPELYGRFA